ncbi:hypothetical protein D047_4733A, partial [Vibrio parahaemolyticus VPTS-2010_2]
MRADPV